ncbi:hypothetical protein MLD38_024681 [Melastoma candidum]|uniref:Uncharacterized protein n=1 Tax=Melastoma candidum TaxID=119954 RepID=A0ACB9NUR5_9MYRT|nr:hypothetical protein MLD38_024681 [Melastoma candidum]
MERHVRSSLPSRLRQLFSGDAAIGVSVRLDSDPPPKVKAFIDKVIQSPLQDIAIPLSGFHWVYDKGNFHHWRPLFLHFDTYFKEHLSRRNDLLLTDEIVDDESPFPKHEVLQILRVMQIILENCPNKSTFDGLEHFKLLLSSTDPEVLIGALETLSAVVKINPSKLHGSSKSVGCGSVNSHLLSLAQGWGSKEEGLGLYSCVVAHERLQEEGLCLFPSEFDEENENSHYRLGSTLYFELNGSPWKVEETGSGATGSSSRIIHIPDLHLRKEDDLAIMRQCIQQYNVPPDLRFPLLTRIRYAHAFRSARTCRLYSRICLLSFIVLVQSNDAHDELTSFFANEPEYTNELIRIVRSEESIPGTIRTLAMLSLGAQLAAYISSHERARILSGSGPSFTATHRTVILNVLQKAVLSLNSSNDPSSLAFVEALLQFYMLNIVSSSTSGNILRGWGMLSTFLPLLEDTDPGHMNVVCLAVKTIQKLLDYSSSAVPHFRELGGVEILVQRLQLEVQRVIGLSVGSDCPVVSGECSRNSEDLLSSQKRLIRVLLKALGSAAFGSVNAHRSQNPQDNILATTLAHIFGHVGMFGGEIYHSAVTLMSEMIHKDPTCLSSLFEVGLPDAFLSSVVSGVLPSAKALTCVPNGLGAICLNNKGVEAVKETKALRFLVDTFTSKKYVVAMNEAIVHLANAVEELLRHVSSLRNDGVDIIVEIVDKISSLRESHSVGTSGKFSGSTAMDMDCESEENESGRGLVSSGDLAPEGISDGQFIQLVVFHLMVLVHRSMENTETCRLFVEKSGIDALLKLLLQPSIAQSSEGMSIALHSSMVFKGFTQHHSAPLSHAFCSALREHLKKALACLLSSSGTFLLDPGRMSPDENIFSSLSLVEFLLFLAATKENRWVTALLAEFSNGSKDVLEDIGCIHREIMWQISLLEDAKPEIEEDAGTSTESQSDNGAHETEEQRFEQRFNTFRQFLDPLLRRRSSGWSMESQFFELMNLYRDIGRSTSFHQRLSSDGHSSIRSGHRSQSESSDIPGKKEIDKQRAYYASCCDMIRSLSFHITHLFQELGKVMLLPSRRREESVNITPASKSVASTFASISLDHMNFGSNVSTSGSQSPISEKCRYFGKVVDFIDGILMDRLDSCNPVLLNCFYGLGAVQTVLTTFEATSQLLFTVNKSPSSPMETDDGIAKRDLEEAADSLWLYGSLGSYGKLMDHLVTSSFILSPSTKHLLSQPLISGDVPFPRDADTFVKVLHSMVLKAVLPVWTHPQFADCNNDFITTVICIIKHVFSGIEVKNSNSNMSSRITGPPPSEATISTIAEMGFSRSRAEEALRQVGSNSVELAMEWLFSHPEEAEEDDELARALAMSLGNSESDTRENAVDESSHRLDAEVIQLPAVEDLLSTCMRLLQVKESLAFPVHDLLMTIASQNDGQYKSSIVQSIVEHMKSCGTAPDNRNNVVLSSLFHVLALTLNEDVAAREIALKNGLIELAVNLLSKWDPDSANKDKSEVPKWVAAAFLAVDRMVQSDHKLNAEILDQLKKDDTSLQENTVRIGDGMKSKLHSALGLSPNHINVQEQKRLIEIACCYLRIQLPSETAHAVLQLCATLTRTHSVAISFLDAGGLSFLLSLPSHSLFPGFDSIAATIICHVLEDPQTLQLAMESEIKHSLVVASNSHSNGRVSARNFLLNLSSVISRDPVIFMQAAQSVCQVEMVGERPYIVLLKDREKEKSKDKEKEDRQQTADKLSLGGINTVGQGIGQAKHSDVNSKSTKTLRKYPQSFVTVIELLVDAVSSFVPPSLDEGNQSSSSSADMEIDVAVAKGKGKAIMDSSEERDASTADASTSIAKVVFILKLVTEIILMYATSVQVLLRKDLDQRGCGPGIFYHVLHRLLPCAKVSKKEKKVDGDWKQKLSTRCSQFLVASCVRSAEARKRVFTEINYLFSESINSAKSVHRTGSELQVFVDVLNNILAARSPAGSCISAEASATFIEAGLMKSLTQILKVLDLDDSDSPKVVTGLIKALELVSKEHVSSSGSNAVKGESSDKASGNNQSTRTENNGEVPDAMQTAFQSNNESENVESVAPFNVLHSYGESEAVADDMEHDQEFDGGSPPASEDDYMHETSEEARGNDIGIDSGGLPFEIQPHAQDNIDEDDDDDDEEMSGDEGDEVDEDDEDDDEDHNDLEEDEVHHLPHPDTDPDEQDIDDDDDGFEEEVVEADEDDDEDDEDDDDGLILRLEEGINGINVFDHIEVLGRNHSFANETVRLMPVEVFGSRRHGRTSSIYDLLGRSGSNPVPSRHPLLMRSAQPSSRPTESVSDGVLSDRNVDGNVSRLDIIFRSLRSGRHGHRLNLWMDDNQRSSGSTAASIPQGLEDLLISQLRSRAAANPSAQTISADVQDEVGNSRNQNSEGSTTPAVAVGNSTNHGAGDVALTSTPGSEIAEVANEPHRRSNASGACPQSVEMQLEITEPAVRDVEAISQESGGSGATLGESLLSLDVEIGSADGQDDGGERQGADRSTLGDLQSVRPRRAHSSTGASVAPSGRETPLHRVAEVPENSGGAEEDGSSTGQQTRNDSVSGAIDPAFLDALPEELRAEVLSSQQGQVAQPENADTESTGDIDPEFLAALPPDIRAEVLAQQQAQRRHQSQELEGQPVEMDPVSIIATFPAELREEVLLTSSDAILANLSPALVAEANMLRERFAHRHHNRTLFGMYPRSRRGESSRRGEGAGSGLERSRDGIGSFRSIGAKFVEADGAPLVDTEAVQAMIRILRVVQPLYKGQLQRLLLNLSSHGETRSAVVKILLGMLMLDTKKPINQGDGVEPSSRLYACQNNVMYSRPHSIDGIPPLVSRRVLETMTYLSRNHPFVAKALLRLRLSQQVMLPKTDRLRGKAVKDDGLNEDWHPEGHLPIELLLQLLNQPLYLRSIAHLEQLLSLLEVIIDNAESKHTTPDKSGDSSMVQTAPVAASSDVEHIEVEHPTVSSAEAAMADSGKTTCEKNDNDALFLANLPQAELRLLCSLLAKEGLSDNAYGLVAEVVKKLVIAAPAHGRLFITELSNSVQTLTKAAMKELHVFGEAVKALLSLASSEGASVLRVLQALSSLVTTLIEKKKEKQIQADLEKEYDDAIAQVWEINSALDPLWLELSNCINKIESYSESTLDSSGPSKTSRAGQSGSVTSLPAGAQNILPYIESFFVVAEKLHPAQTGRSYDSGAPSTSEMEDSNTITEQLKSPVKFDEKHAPFVRFSERHRKLLNAFVRQNPALLEKSFSLLLKVPRFIDFDNKRAHFRSKIKHQHDHHHSPLRISVRRAYILEDSYNQLRLRSTLDLKGRLTVNFQGEEGIDAGGLTREWYQLLSRVIFDKGALLFTTVGNESTFQPNPNSVYQTEHLSYFKFVGRVVGKALFDGQLLDVHFTRSFYKHILGAKVTYNDIEAIDPDYFKNLKWMLENDITDVPDLTFSIDADEEKLILYERTEVTDHELIPNGRNIKVTEENKHQYVDLVAEHRLTTAIRPQINAFLEGFGELIPRDLISIFNDKELELLISGLPDIDLDDLRANTEYSGYSAASPVIQWFWEVVQVFSKEDKARLLQFVTGTSKVPLEGFSALQGISGSQKFQIHKAYGSPDHLPSAHTCFNQLDMPEYPSKEQLEERLLLAIHEGNEGFGFG